MKKALFTTMYNRNYGGFDYIRIHSELLRLVFNPKIIANLPVTDGYTRPLYVSLTRPEIRLHNFKHYVQK